MNTQQTQSKWTGDDPELIALETSKLCDRTWNRDEIIEVLSSYIMEHGTPRSFRKHVALCAAERIGDDPKPVEQAPMKSPSPSDNDIAPGHNPFAITNNQVNPLGTSRFRLLDTDEIDTERLFVVPCLQCWNGCGWEDGYVRGSSNSSAYRTDKTRKEFAAVIKHLSKINAPKTPKKNISRGHNPDGLSAHEVDPLFMGYRLLEKDEINPNRTYFLSLVDAYLPSEKAWTLHPLLVDDYACTYRTKLSREEFRSYAEAEAKKAKDSRNRKFKPSKNHKDSPNLKRKPSRKS